MAFYRDLTRITVSDIISECEELVLCTKEGRGRGWKGGVGDCEIKIDGASTVNLVLYSVASE